MLYLVEPVVPDDPDELRADGGMLMSDPTCWSVGGRERTATEFAAIVGRAGLRIDGLARCDPSDSLSVLRVLPATG